MTRRTGDPMYKHIPFYVRINDEQRHALGLFYHNSYDSVFDMGQEISGYWDPYCYYQTDGGDIDLFLLNGPSVAAVLDRFPLSEYFGASPGTRCWTPCFI